MSIDFSVGMKRMHLVEFMPTPRKMAVLDGRVILFLAILSPKVCIWCRAVQSLCKHEVYE